MSINQKELLYQVLFTLLIWLVVFSIYLIPVALIAWFIWHRTHPKQSVSSPAATTGSSQTGS